MLKKLLVVLLVFFSAYAGNSVFAQSLKEPSNSKFEKANCDECKNLADFLNKNRDKNPAESKRRKELLEKLLGILDELEKANTTFTDKGDFTDIFAAAYYHVTEMEMQNIMNDKFAYPAEKMEMMIDFYDAYRYNREMWDSGQSNNVEPQWLNYFKNAQAFNKTMKDSSVFGPSDGIELMKVIDSGIQAHVGFDLPRAIRNNYQNNVASSVDQQTLTAEFLNSNALFVPAMEAANTDVSAALSRSQIAYPKPAALNLAASFGKSSESVIQMRENALKLGTSNENLPTAIRPQPRTNHQKLIQNGKAILEKKQKDCESQLFNVTGRWSYPVLMNQWYRYLELTQTGNKITGTVRDSGMTRGMTLGIIEGIIEGDKVMLIETSRNKDGKEVKYPFPLILNPNGLSMTGIDVFFYSKGSKIVATRKNLPCAEK